MRAWRTGHKGDCKDWQRVRDKAVRVSGSADAWTDLIRWLEVHHDTLANAALACLISSGPGSESKFTYIVTAKYNPTPGLPAERRFSCGFCGSLDMPQDLSSILQTIPENSRGDSATMMRLVLTTGAVAMRSNAASEAEKEALSNGTIPMRAGSYLLALDFGDGRFTALPRIFLFSDDHLKASVHQLFRKDPRRVLEHQFSKGRGPKFCCGTVPELSTCCCGGWVHAERGVRPRLPRSVDWTDY